MIKEKTKNRKRKAYSWISLKRYHTVHISLPCSACLIKGLGFIVIRSNHQRIGGNSFSIQSSFHEHRASVVYAEITWWKDVIESLVNFTISLDSVLSFHNTPPLAKCFYICFGLFQISTASVRHIKFSQPCFHIFVSTGAWKYIKYMRNMCYNQTSETKIRQSTYISLAYQQKGLLLNSLLILYPTTLLNKLFAFWIGMGYEIIFTQVRALTNTNTFLVLWEKHQYRYF